MDNCKYLKELVYDPKNGTIRNMVGQLAWRIGYFLEKLEPTGNEIRSTDFEPGGDDYEEEYECTYRKEITKEEYQENK